MTAGGATLGAGLPRDQIGEPHILTMMTASGPTTEPEENMKRELVGYTTVLSRRIEGVLVPDSFALARFNANDEVTTEWVHWPPIPRHVLAEAHALEKALADHQSKAAFMARLPAEAQAAPGEVTIRHSDFDDESNFTSFASYDVHLASGAGHSSRATTRNFRTDGTEFSHPNRRRQSVNKMATDSPKP